MVPEVRAVFDIDLVATFESYREVNFDFWFQFLPPFRAWITLSNLMFLLPELIAQQVFGILHLGGKPVYIVSQHITEGFG